MEVDSCDQRSTRQFNLSQVCSMGLKSSDIDGKVMLSNALLLKNAIETREVYMCASVLSYTDT